MLNLYTYSLPFHRPFRTGAGDFTHRKGVVLVFQHGAVSTVAEASPLPGFSPESIEEVLDATSVSSNETESFFRSDFTGNNLKEFLNEVPQLPSLQFALSYMGIDILLQRKAAGFSSLFGRIPASTMAVNYTIGGDEPRIVEKELHNGIRQGYKTFKFKAPWPVEELIRFLNKTVPQLPGIRLRLDANRTWPENSVLKTLQTISKLPVEYVEEPSAFDTLDSFISTAEQSPVPLAADESLTGPDDAEYLKRSEKNIIRIIKPAIMGSIFKMHETFSGFGSPVDDNDVVFTTALESGIGRQMVASAACLLGDRNRAHGLSTGRFLASDLITGPDTVKGVISPDFQPFSSPGLGRINTKLLKSV